MPNEPKHGSDAGREMLTPVVNRSQTSRSGKASFADIKLVEYYGAPLDEVLRTKPTASRGRYLKKVTVSTTTRPGHPGGPVGDAQLRRT